MSFEIRQHESGFYQSREVYPGSMPGPWKFQISGFDYLGDPNKCRVLKRIGNPPQLSTYDAVAIDAKGRILIGNKWYSREHWNH